MSPDLLERAARTLRQHALTLGFDVGDAGDRALLADRAALPRALLERVHGDDAAGSPSVADVVQLALALDVDVGELLSAPRRDFELLPVHPFFGGEPLHLSVPRAWVGTAPRSERLFYIRTDEADAESGLPPRSVVIAQRGEYAPRVGSAYVLEREDGYLIRRCTARLPTGAWVLGAFQDTGEHRDAGMAAPSPPSTVPVVLSARHPGRLRLVTADDAGAPDPGPWVVGRVLGVWQPETGDAARRR